MQHGDATAVSRIPARPHQRGVALVECALVLPSLLLVVLGVAEIGRMTRSQLALAQAAREGAQAAARGLTVERIRTRVLNTAEVGGLVRAAVTITALQRSSNGTSWQDLGNTADGTQNDARRQHLVRIQVAYQHPLLSRLVFPVPTRTLTSSIVARRTL